MQKQMVSADWDVNVNEQTHLVRVLQSTLWRNSREPETLPVPIKADWLDEIERSLTCDQTLAGVTGGQRVDAVW